MCGKISGKLICGIGFNNGEYPCNNGKYNAIEYEHWRGMLRRCQEIWWVKHPAYNETSCSENFKHYSFFYEWCHKQIGFGNKDNKGKLWQLDKDLLVGGSKVYSEDTCIFLPQEINKLIVKNKPTRGEYPIGVHWDKKLKKFISQCNGVSENSKHLGCFDTQHEAFEAYKTFKESYIKRKANEYKSQLDPRAYQALLNYTVEITN